MAKKTEHKQQKQCHNNSIKALKNGPQQKKVLNIFLKRESPQEKNGRLPSSVTKWHHDAFTAPPLSALQASETLQRLGKTAEEAYVGARNFVNRGKLPLKTKRLALAYTALVFAVNTSAWEACLSSLDECGIKR